MCSSSLGSALASSAPTSRARFVPSPNLRAPRSCWSLTRSLLLAARMLSRQEVGGEEVSGRGSKGSGAERAGRGRRMGRGKRRREGGAQYHVRPKIEDMSGRKEAEIASSGMRRVQRRRRREGCGNLKSGGQGEGLGT
eukprot:741295-Hanusia_phi.AAC.2